MCSDQAELNVMKPFKLNASIILFGSKLHYLSGLKSGKRIDCNLKKWLKDELLMKSCGSGVAYRDPPQKLEQE